MRPFDTTAAPHCAALLLATLMAPAMQAQCPSEPPLRNYTGSGTVTCPCFVAGERAGVVLQAPAIHYPLEILKVRIGWGSQFGGTRPSTERAILIYPSGLPNPGSPQLTFPSPVLTDGFINEFDLQAVTGNKTITSGPFTVALEFANSNAGQLFAPSVVHDGNGCQRGANVVFAIPGGWNDACALGVTGDWLFEVVYRPVNCPTATCVVRTGSGTNPSGYACVTNPVVGTTWRSSIPTTPTTVGTWIALSTTAIGGLPTAFGELLIAAAPAPVMIAGNGSHAVPIPTLASLVGASLSTQGVRVDAPAGTPVVALLNAVDLVLGL